MNIIAFGGAGISNAARIPIFEEVPKFIKEHVFLPRKKEE